MTGLTRARTAGPGPRRWAAIAGAAAVSVALAACGSQLDPDDVAGTGALAGTVDEGGQPLIGDAGVAGGDTGVPGDAGTSAGATGDSAGTAGGTTAGGASGAGAAAGGATQGKGRSSATGGQKAGSCEGFKNQTGITDDKIVVANVSDISGPVPGIFESAQQATRAYAAYINANGGICGRKLEVVNLDSRADAGADQNAYARACETAFAAVGSQSAFDFGGAGTAQGCGLPDLRAYSVSSERTACTTCFAAAAVKPNLVGSAMPQYWVKKDPEAVKSVGLVYINAGAAPDNAKSFKAAWEKNGWTISVFQGMDVAEFNYAPVVQALKDANAQMAIYVGPYQNTVKLQQAMAQQGYKPKVFLQDATIEDQRYIEQAGEHGEGTYVYSQTALFDDLSNPEMKLYRGWLQQVDPSATPNTYGVHAWSATRLFVETATRLGAGLTRESLIQELSKVKDWTGNGIHVPQQVGAETTANCVNIKQLQSGKWVQVSPGKYLCGPLTDTGL